MAFMIKTDPFGIADSDIVCVSTGDGRAAQVVEATDQYGTIKASEVFGETISPTAEYRLKDDASLSVALGGVSTFDGKSVALQGITINTSAGNPPTVNASGVQVEDNATSNCVYNLAGNVDFCHHAQILFGAFSVGGSGCYLQTANYSASCGITQATKEGVCIAHDAVNGRIQATVEIKQTGSDEPSLSAGAAWVVISPLACSNPDSDYPTYSATLVKYLDRN